MNPISTILGWVTGKGKRIKNEARNDMARTANQAVNDTLRKK